MFKVRLNSMTEAEASMKLISKQLNMYQDELNMAKRSLETLSYMEEPCRDIQKSQEKLERLSSKFMQAEKILEGIRQEYQQRENAVINYCEENGKKSRRRKIVYYDFEWIDDFLRRG